MNCCTMNMPIKMISKEEGIDDIHVCALCGRTFKGFGNNPEPVLSFEKRVCNECNENIVIPERIKKWLKK